VAVHKDQGKYYQIVVSGHLEAHWSEWFNGMTIHKIPGEETMLSGHIVDQAALHGLLIKIRDLGLPLVSLCTVDKRDKTENGE
jgi:hypothetical protein